LGLRVQHKIDWRGSRTGVLSLPVFQTVTPETPELRGATGDFEPVVTDEEEVVRALSYSGKVVATEVWHDVQMEDVPEDFRRYARDVQRGVSRPFESDKLRRYFFDPFIQR
jgi:hypothetical protein